VDGNKMERNIEAYRLKTLFSSDNIDRIDKIEDEINKTPYHYGK
jgi:hypothetical protein